MVSATTSRFNFNSGENVKRFNIVTVLDPSWPIEQRVRVASQLAAFISFNTKQGLPYNQLGTPNAETILIVLAGKPDLLNESFENVYNFVQQHEQLFPLIDRLAACQTGVDRLNLFQETGF